MRKSIHGFLFPIWLWGSAWRPFGPPELRYKGETLVPASAVSDRPRLVSDRPRLAYQIGVTRYKSAYEPEVAYQARAYPTPPWM